MGLTRHSGTEGELLRKNARLWVALAGATVIAGLFVGFGMSNGSGKNQSAKRVGIASRVAGGTQASASTSSGLEGVACSEDRARACRASRGRFATCAHVKPGKHHNTREVSRGEALGSLPAPAARRQFRPRPAAARCLRRSRTSTAFRACAAAFRPTPRATWGRTTTCSGSTPLRDLHEDGHAGRRDAARQRLVGRQFERSHLPRQQRRRPDRRSTTSTRAAGSRRSSRLPNYPNGPFYQCVAVSTSNDPSGTWCGYQYTVSANKLNDYPKFGVWPTQNAYMATINQFIAPGIGWGGVGIMAFERDQMIACGPARMLYRDMFPRRPDLWGGMLPADRRRPDAAACKCARADDRGRRPRLGSAELPGGSPRRLERDCRLERGRAR